MKSDELLPAEPVIEGITDERLCQALEQYVVALSAGDAGARERWLAQHPDLIGLIRCVDVLERLAVPAPAPPAVVPHCGDETTLIGIETGVEAVDVQPIHTVFGRYELLGELGRGGMGVVYRARQTDLDRVVALKMIRSQQLASAEELRRFQIEAQACARLRHPHIVAIHDVGQVGNQHFFTMDLVEGTNLSTLTHRGSLEAEQAARCLILVAGAVHYLHVQGIVHRDLKPQNILLDEHGRPFVTDFGLAKLMREDSSQTQSGAILGTPSYMSPEQAAGRQREVSPRSDVYSLGAILYEMLTGRPPFREENFVDTLLAVMEAEPTLPSELNRRTPRELESICLKCLEKDPLKRYGSAAELAEDLERFIRGEVTVAQPPKLTGRAWRLIRRHPGLAVHWVAMATALLSVQVRHWRAPETIPNYPWIVTSLLVWIASAFVLDLLLQRHRTAEAARAGWCLVDVLLFTVILGFVSEPLGPLVAGFPLLIAAAGLLARLSLVVATTVASMMAYIMLLIFRHESTPVYHASLCLMMLAAVGVIVAVQVYRLRALNRFHEGTRETIDRSRLSG